MVDKPGAVATEPATWAAYAAAVWAFAFAVPSFYWAAGGTVGVGAVSPAITEMAREPWFVALV